MAKTKGGVDREHKRGEILCVAMRLFLEDGYQSTSMQRIAADVRVAPNTLYWYFEDKDALLIAVLDSLVAEGLREFEQRESGSLEARLLWLLGALSGAQHLIATVHARMASVERVRLWHDGFHGMLEANVERQLRSHGLAQEREGHAARTAMFVIEGLLAHPTARHEERELVKWLVALVQRDATAA